MTEPRPEPCGTPQESETDEEERLPAITDNLGLLWTASQTSTHGLGGVIFLPHIFYHKCEDRGYLQMNRLSLGDGILSFLLNCDI